MAQRVKGITVVSPIFGDRTKIDRIIFSVITQFISEQNPFKIHLILILVDDYIERPKETDESYYSYYLRRFKKFHNLDKNKITIIKNEKHKYQCESRKKDF